MARLILPTDEGDLVEALKAELATSVVESNLHLVTWKIIDAYLAGVRRFKILDRWSGNLSLAFENARGDLDLRYEGVVQKYLVETGRYMKGDFSPVVTRRGDSLGALRKAGIAHAILGATASKINLRTFKKRLVTNFLKYGTVGLIHYETGDSRMPDMVDVVSPRQLLGLPAWVDGSENLWGICRRRWVPLSWIVGRLRDSLGKELRFTDAREELEAQDVPWGSVAPGYTVNEGGASGGATWVMPKVDVIGDMDRDSERRSRVSAKPEGMVDAYGRMFVPLEETYVYDDTGEFVSRYIMKIGRKVPVDVNFEEMGAKVLCPLQVARHTDTGRFFARGFVGPLIPFNDQIEKMMASLFKNVTELDAFGTLFVTGAMGVDLKKWRTGPRPKADKYEPDPLSPGAQPITLQPSNTGLLPSRLVEFGTGVMDRLANQGPIYSGENVGRVEAGAAMGFLYNTGNIALGLPVNNLSDAIAGVYARMLQAVKDRSSPGSILELANISDAVAGVIIDPNSGSVELAQNPIPDPWEVNVDIKDRTPREPDIRKRELLDLYGAQLVDYNRFWITAFEENLDFPGPPKDIWETWRKVQYQIVVLFRDGKQPGPLFLGEHTQNPAIQLLAVQQFMNRIEYSLASKEVRKVFEQWKEALEGLAGVRYPAGLGPPEQLAQQQMQMMQQAEQAQMSGGV